MDDDIYTPFTSKASINALQRHFPKHIKIVSWEHDDSTKSGVVIYHHKEQKEFNDEVSYTWMDDEWKVYADFYDGYDIIHTWLGIMDVQCHTKKKLLEALEKDVCTQYVSFVFQYPVRYGPMSILHHIISTNV